MGQARAELIGSLYRQSLADIRVVLEGRDARLTGLLWMQGEADSKREETAIAYADNMARLIAAFREDLQVPQMRVIMGLVNPDTPRHLYVATVQARMRALAAGDALVDVVSADGLQRIRDRVHYDHVGQVELGQRFAAVWLANR